MEKGPPIRNSKALEDIGGMGVVLKNERRTSNVQHRIKKQTYNTEHSTTIPISFQLF